eukprot:11333550-Ditylum_brightwellii.AAC.1
MNLRAGKVITRRDFDEVPTPHRVIQCINKLGASQKQQVDLLFYDCNQILIADDDDDTATGNLDATSAVGSITGVDMGDDNGPDDPDGDKHDPGNNKNNNTTVGAGAGSHSDSLDGPH